VPGRRSLRLFIGCYEQDDAAGEPGFGIVAASFDPDSLEFTVSGGAQAQNASFLAFAPGGDLLYAVREASAGQIATLAIDPADDLAGGAPTPVAETSSGGADPCYLALDASGRYLLGANYSSGDVSVHRLAADGTVGELCDLVSLADSAPEGAGDTVSHAHMVLPAPSGDAILTVDLGADTISAHTLDLATGRLKLLAASRLRPGAGTRHLAFHPSGEFLYVANEFGNSVTACSYDPASGTVEELAEYPAAPREDDVTSYPSGIVISPDGRYVYVGNRGDESITAFAVIGEGAQLRAVGRWSCGGSWPRHLTLSPDGSLLFCANQRSNNVIMFHVDQADGTLSATAAELRLVHPAHVLIG
jgi:6-phosphogluconolactonase